jgi:hypothetical protein
MRLRGLIGMLIAATSLGAPPDPVACMPFPVGPPGCLQEVVWYSTFYEETLTVHRVPDIGTFVDDRDRRWRALFAPFCGGNRAGDEIVGFEMCVGAIAECQRRGHDDLAAMYMEITPLFGGERRRVEGPICLGGATYVELGSIIDEAIQDEIGPQVPEIWLQPADALVQLPMIACTQAREPIEIELDDPVVGTVTATPTYTWTFGDGGVAHGPGRPYDGTSPRQNPGYYVTNTYRSTGPHTVELTVTWYVTFTMPGYDPIPLDDIVRAASTSTTVRSAQSELIGG